MRESEAKFRLLFENMINGFALHEMIYDVQGHGVDYRFLEVNPAFEKLTGVLAVDLVGKTVRELMPATEQYWLDTYEKVARTGEPAAFQNYSRELGKHFDVWAFSPSKGLFATVFIDITERKGMEDKLRETLADLQRSNKELEQFAYVASHDLQEPLRMVSSFTQLLAHHYEGRLDDKAQKYIHYAVDGAVRMQLLINDLLAFSRVGTRVKPLELTDSHAVLGGVINNLKVYIDEVQALVTNDDLPEVLVDASQLAQLLQNLISNALKFRGAERPLVHLSARDEGREWLFSVRDNGIGIEPQYADKVFVIFQRLHAREQYPGSGIGLAICKKIVDRHGGRIWFESELGKGTTFYFTIPK